MTTMEELDRSNIPVWDMRSLCGFASVQDEQYIIVIEELEKRLGSFKRKYRGELKTKLVASLLEYNDLSETLAALQAGLRAMMDIDSSDECVKRGSFLESKIDGAVSEQLSFWTVEVCALEDGNVQEQLAAAGKVLSEAFRRYITRIRILKPHLFSEEVEQALSIREPYYGTRPVVEFFNRAVTNSRFEWVHPATKAEKILGLEEVLLLMKDADWKVRRAGMKCLNEGLVKNGLDTVGTLTLDVVAGESHIDRQLRKFRSLRSSKCLSNLLSEEAVDAMLAAVRARGSELAKRFYKLKSDILKKTQKLPEFTWADRNADIVLEGVTKPLIQFAEAKNIVRSSFEAFSPSVAKLFVQLEEEGRIDALVRPGKKGSAFCIMGTEKSGPMVLMNYQGTQNCVCTLAHECGHAINAIHANRSLPYVQTWMGAALAEVASTFGEEMVFMDLVRRAETRQDKLALLMSKCDDMINTTVRQCALDRFEELFHTARADGTICQNDLQQFWMQCTKEYYGEEGECFDKYDDMQNHWIYIPHFTIYPFYVHCYAIAGLIVGSIRKVYQDQSLPNFADTYAQFLSSGAALDVNEQMKLFGLDANSSTFWEDALECHLGALLQQAETIAADLGFR